jgi:hypothetical protein
MLVSRGECNNVYAVSAYQETAAQLNATGLLVGQTSVKVFEAQGGTLELEALAHLLEKTNKQFSGQRMREHHHG